MEPFVPAVDAFHERTAASDFLEGLVKAYVGEGIAQDFYREISRYVDEDTRSLVVSVLEDTGQADFAVTVVREAITTDPRLAGRLALWGRRLVGEAITQAQRVGVERDALASILVGAPGRAGADLAEARPHVRPPHRRALPPDGASRPVGLRAYAALPPRARRGAEGVVTRGHDTAYAMARRATSGRVPDMPRGPTADGRALGQCVGQTDLLVMRP